MMSTYRNKLSSKDSDSLRAFCNISFSLVSRASIPVALCTVGKVLGLTENNTTKVSISFVYWIIFLQKCREKAISTIKVSQSILLFSRCSKEVTDFSTSNWCLACFPVTWARKEEGNVVISKCSKLGVYFHNEGTKEQKKLSFAKMFVVAQPVNCSCFPTFFTFDLKLIEDHRVRVQQLDICGEMV